MATRVLLVEDSRAMREYLSSILESHGDFEIVEAANGFEALRMLPRDDFALIISDVNMPDVSGIELARFVRKSSRHGATPLLAISTESSGIDKNRALASGASAFLAKPFRDAQLVDCVNNLIAEAAKSTGSDS